MNLVRPEIDAMEDSPILEVWRSGIDRPGIIALWAGEPDVPTPAFICEPAIAALRAGHTFYTHNRGIPELRAAIARYLKRLYGGDIADGRIAVTSAGMNAVEIICQALLGAGSKAVAITPCWPNVMRAMTINGAEVTQVPLSHSNQGWTLDLDAVEAACVPGVKMLYLASPANPTGWTITRSEAERLLELTRSRGIALFSDEVYHRILYDAPVAFSFLQLASPDDNVFVVNSFSKSWAMTGWRLGWMVFPDGLAHEFEKLIQFNTSGAQAFLQYGAIAALNEGEEFVAWFVGRCRKGHAVIEERLAGIPRVHHIPNNASFYAMFEVDGMADSLGFCRRAVTEAHIGMAPGIAFGTGAGRMVRLCYAKAPALLHEAMDRLAAFVADYRE
jgi:aspartate/methionine/tyrosine aminotransferase